MKGLRSQWRPKDQFLVRHKDASLLVVEKKAGILTVPQPSQRGVDLKGLLTQFLQQNRKQHRSGLFVVHRLDRAVSGLLVFPRTFAAYRGLRRQFEAHSVERVYVAAVEGLLKEDQGSFRSTLANEGPDLKMHSSEKGRLAITHWKVLERLEAARVTLVEVRLETGLRNQIRVHFSEAGHPLLGEKKYAPVVPETTPKRSLSRKEAEQAAQEQRFRNERIFLHARVLGFVHPITQQTLRFEAPLPPDLSGWYRRLQFAAKAARPAAAQTAPHPAKPQRAKVAKRPRRRA